LEIYFPRRWTLRDHGFSIPRLRQDPFPLQRAFVECHGLQCGFCTPGFLMLAANAIERNPRIGDQQLVDILSSNLCRCTGYKNIVEAVRVGRAEMLERLDTDE
jgi:aerobic-type carbon monoxide dehydrogenase small subunit (CoxS/CutS family)